MTRRAMVRSRCCGTQLLVSFITRFSMMTYLQAMHEGERIFLILCTENVRKINSMYSQKARAAELKHIQKHAHSDGSCREEAGYPRQVVHACALAVWVKGQAPCAWRGAPQLLKQAAPRKKTAKKLVIWYQVGAAKPINRGDTQMPVSLPATDKASVVVLALALRNVIVLISGKTH
eukprot:1141652-Pelagomonas_calceolata.AAC.1